MYRKFSLADGSETFAESYGGDLKAAKEYRITRVAPGRVILYRVSLDRTHNELVVEASRRIHCYSEAPLFPFNVGSVGTTESGMGPGMLQLGLAIVVDAGAAPGMRIDLGQRFAEEFLAGVTLAVGEHKTFDATEVRAWVDARVQAWR